MDKIVVDVYGGDYAPTEIITGCVQALEDDKDIFLILSGNEEEIKKLLIEQNADMTRIEIMPASEVITNDDVPTVAIRKKQDSSLVKALRRVKEDDTIVGMLSAGSTGAVLTGSLLIIGRVEGVYRPALAPLLPNMKGGQTLLIDCGANVDCKPEFLAQFAVMGSQYVKAMTGIENPRVCLLSNGAEDKKGNELNHAAFQMLKKLPIDFKGNVEARYILNGDYDVVVADGFDGNVCVKSIEGTVGLIMAILKEEISARAGAKFGYLFMKPALKALKKRIDYTAMGGAAFVGCKKIVVKAHGSAKAKTIRASIAQIKRLAKVNGAEMVREGIAQVDWESVING